MSKSMREVIVLYYYLEIPQSKIAEIMSILHGLVRTLIYRGRKILKLRENPIVEHIYIEDTKLSLDTK